MVVSGQSCTPLVRTNLRGGTGEVSFVSWFKPEDFGADISLCSHITLAQGASIGMHQHLNEDELYFITTGQGIISEEGKPDIPVTAGDAVLTRHGESHMITNTGTGDLAMIAVISRYAKQV